MTRIGQPGPILGRMPLSLRRKSIDRWSHLPLYRQLADAVRAAITDGELQPGEALPSEAELGTSLGLSRTAVRAGMDLLVSEGLVSRSKGAPSRVSTRPPVRRVESGRYAAELRILQAGGEHPQASAFTRDYGIDWHEQTYDVRFAEDRATPADAERLQLAVGDAVLRRRMVKYVQGRPVQIQESVLPMGLVAGTPVADPDNQPWPGGTLAELWSLGLMREADGRKVIEEVQARLPRPDERRDLDIDPDAMVPVATILRTFIDRHRPVAVTVDVADAAQSVLVYETDLSDVSDA